MSHRASRGMRLWECGFAVLQKRSQVLIEPLVAVTRARFLQLWSWVGSWRPTEADADLGSAKAALSTNKTFTHSPKQGDLLFVAAVAAQTDTLLRVPRSVYTCFQIDLFNSTKSSSFITFRAYALLTVIG